MNISLIVAMAENRVIGGDNKLLWHIPEDLKHFKALTMGKPIIMGRKTYESIGKPLPGRHNIVISRQTYSGPAIYPVRTIQTALTIAEDLASEEIMIIGGAQIYAAALPFATRVYLTLIHKVYDGDALFPELPPSEWEETDRQKGAEDFYEFLTYQRIK